MHWRSRLGFHRPGGRSELCRGLSLAAGYALSLLATEINEQADASTDELTLQQFEQAVMSWGQQILPLMMRADHAEDPRLRPSEVVRAKQTGGLMRMVTTTLENR